MRDSQAQLSLRLHFARPIAVLQVASKPASVDSGSYRLSQSPCSPKSSVVVLWAFSGKRDHGRLARWLVLFARFWAFLRNACQPSSFVFEARSCVLAFLRTFPERLHGILRKVPGKVSGILRKMFPRRLPPSIHKQGILRTWAYPVLARKSARCG